MKRGRLFSLVGAAAVMLAGCRVFGGGPVEVRYKVTLEVEQSGRVRSGSSVWSWTLSKAGAPLASAYNGKFEGEAVAVELADRGWLFAVLRGGDGDEGAMMLLPERLFGDIGRDARGETKQYPSDRVADLRDIASRVGERRVLDCRARANWCPLLVTFADIDNPESVSEIDPVGFNDGSGPPIRVRQIVVEIVDAPVTRGIKQRLPWLVSLGRERATLIPTPPRYLSEATPLRLLSPSAFATGLYR